MGLQLAVQRILNLLRRLFKEQEKIFKAHSVADTVLGSAHKTARVWPSSVPILMETTHKQIPALYVGWS